jgi:hypothetical protein
VAVRWSLEKTSATSSVLTVQAEIVDRNLAQLVPVHEIQREMSVLIEPDSIRSLGRAFRL